MDRFDPFVKYADVYGDIINWEKDPMNRPQNQNKYFFSDGKTYYEQLLRIMRLVSVFKDAFNQIYNNEDEISTAWENFVNNLSATAVPGEDPSVELVWTDDSVQFNFTMPQGLPGPAGPQGVSISSITFNQDYSMTITLSNGQTYTSSSLRGPEGPEGSGLEILDVYPTLADLQTAHPTGSPGDAYQVGSASSFILYIWSASQNAWVNAGTLSSPSPSSALPSMNGTASAGSSMLYSRGDHMHPSDTGKLDKSSTNGVYAVENGSQTMLNATVNPQQGALVKWDTNGTLNANAVDTDTARVQGNISADTGVFQTSVTTDDLTASGNISADTIEVTDNLILNSTKLEGVAGSTNAYQILTTLGADRDVLGMSADATDNTPSVKFMAGKWANNGTMGDATSEVKFNNSFAPDYNYDPTGGRIGLAPASASILGGVKIGSGISITSDGTISASMPDLSVLFPVGAIYQNTTGTNPGTFITGTTWQLISSVALASEHIFGNGLSIGMTTGSNNITLGLMSGGSGNPSVSGASGGYGHNVGTSMGGNNGTTQPSYSLGLKTKTALGNHPEYSGLIADTIKVYMWKRTA